MELSRGHKAVLNGIKKVVNRARKYDTAEEFYNATVHGNAGHRTAEEMKELDPEGWKTEVMWYERERAGVVLIQAKPVLVAGLVSAGIVDVLETDGLGDTCMLVRLNERRKHDQRTVGRA